jgi:formate hydrogenlyase transcriptional activator
MRQLLRILSLEDDPRDAELIQGSLEAEGIACEVTRVDTQPAFQASLEEDRFDLILADYTLPSFDGLSALKLARSTCPDVPFIFVTGTLGEEVAIEALRIGATDYVLKTRLSRLAPSIRRALREADERTERKRAEEALRRNEAYLIEAQTLSHTGSFGWSPSREEIYWSEETFKIFGLEQSVKPTLQLIVQRTHPDDRDLAKRTIDRATGTSANFDVEHRLLMPDGSLKYIHVLARALETSFGNLEFVGAVTDVTAAKQAEMKLRESEAYLAEAQRLSHTGSWAFSPDTGDFRYWSDECFRLMGFDPAGGTPPFETVIQRFHPDDQPIIAAKLERARRERAEFEADYRIIHPGGEIRDIHAVAHPILGPSGDLIEFVGSVIDVTERKHAEKELRQSEESLLEAQRLSHTGSWRADSASGAVSVSPEVYRIHDIRPFEGPSNTEFFFSKFHPEDRKRVVELFEKGRAEKAEFEVDYRIVLPDGTSKYLHTIGHPVLNVSGELIEFIGTTMDVTAAKLAEEKIRQSETELRQLIDAIPQQVFVFSPDWSPLFANQQERDYTGLSSEGARSKDAVAKVFHPEDLKKLEALRERGRLEAAPFELEARIKGKDGQYRWFLIRDNPLLDDQGRIVRWYGTRTDVTERKQAEDSIRQSESELRHILDFTPQQLAVLGPDRARLYLNQATLDYFGLTHEEWQSRDTRRLVHPDDWERMMSETQNKFSSGIPHEAEIRLLGTDGKYRWFLFRYNPLRDEQGRITRWFVAGADIEDRKQIEQQLQNENIALREEIDRASMFEEIVGTSPALRAVLSRVSKVAPTDSTVLITGETGTGKELIARAVHKRSQRSSRPFVGVNCAAIPRDLLASELFGHEKGAFTGALQRRLGRFELAEGGTIFLDEIGELPAETQIALLRVLQEREFERVGGTGSIRTNVRVIAATNRDLQAAISAGTFRSDLFYRLNVFPIEVPPLRERREDISVLVAYFIDRYARKAGMRIRGINKRSLELLQSYPWPGNIRELQNIIERSVIVCDTEYISVDESWLSRQPLASEPKGRPEEGRPEISRRLASREKEMIEAALRESGGRVSGPSGAAVRLGIPGSTLDSKIRSLRIDKNRFKSTYPSTDRN